MPARSVRADPRAPETRPGPSTTAPQAGPALSAYRFQARVWVRVNGRPFTCYRAEPTQKYPYFYPVFGAVTGLPMTDEAGALYPHHRSLFLACDRVNGANFWQEGIDRGQIISRGPSLEATGEDRIVISDRCDWRLPGQPAVMEDRRQFTITSPRPDLRIIDVDVSLTARADIRITRTNHSLFAIRAAHDLAPGGGGALLNDKGQAGEKGTFGQIARWCGFQVVRSGVTESITLMDHPGNPWSPCRWFTRDYGFISPTPFNWLDEQGWRLAVGHSVRLRYRVVVSAGGVLDPPMGRLYEAFAAGS